MDQSLEICTRNYHIKYIIEVCKEYQDRCYDLLKTDPMCDLENASDDLIEAIYDLFQIQIKQNGCIMNELTRTRYATIVKTWENNKVFLKFSCITYFAVYSTKQSIYYCHRILHTIIYTEISEVTGDIVHFDEYKSFRVDICFNFPECVTTYIQLMSPEKDKDKQLSRSWLLDGVLVPQYSSCPTIKHSPKILNCADVLCDFVCRSLINKFGWYQEYRYYIDKYCSSIHHERLIKALALAPERAPFLKDLKTEFLFRFPKDPHIAIFIAERKTNTTERCGICLFHKPGFLHDCRRHSTCFHCYIQCSNSCPYCRFDLQCIKTNIINIITNNSISPRNTDNSFMAGQSPARNVFGQSQVGLLYNNIIPN